MANAALGIPSQKDFWTRNSQFLMSEAWTWLNLVFAIVGLAATTLVIGINYLTTYQGFVMMEFGPAEYRTQLALVFMLFMQAYEFLYPVGDSLDLLNDAPDLRRYFRRIWKIILALDWGTALVFLAGDHLMFSASQVSIGNPLGSLIYVLTFAIVLVPYALGALFFVVAEVFWWWALRVARDRFDFAMKWGKYEKEDAHAPAASTPHAPTPMPQTPPVVGKLNLAPSSNRFGPPALANAGHAPDSNAPAH